MRRLTAVVLALGMFGVPSAGRADGSGGLNESWRALVPGGGVVSDGFGLGAINPGPDGEIGTQDDGRAPSPSTSGTVVIAGIPEGASVVKAFLYWSTLATDDSSVRLDGAPVAGSLIGRSQETCWFNIAEWNPAQDNRVYRADVTSAVAGNGAYTVSEVVESPPGYAQGVSLVVVYSDPQAPWGALVVVNDGAISGGLPGPQHDYMSHAFFDLGVDHTPLAASLHTGMADGNALYRDGAMTFNGGAVAPPDFFAGTDGGLYDDTTVDVPVSLLPAGTTAASNAVTILDDCLLWMYSALEIRVDPPPVRILKPAEGSLHRTGSIEVSGQAASGVASVRLTEGTSTVATAAVSDGTWSATPALANGSHTIVATGLDADGNPLQPAVQVSFGIDTTAPGVAITTPRIVSAAFGAVQVRGTATDNLAVDHIVVTYEHLVLGSSGELPANCPACAAASVDWDARLQLHEAGVYLLRATAYDTAGNATRTAALILVQAVPD